MIYLIQYCDFPWWLAWLLPFLLGFLLAMVIWRKYKLLLDERERDLSASRKAVAQLDADLNECRKAYTSLENENATLRGKIRELETQIRELNTNKKTTTKESNVEDIGLKNPVVNVAEEDISEVDRSSLAADISGAGTAHPSSTANIYAALQQDNLQIIEGIGPKMEEVLKENGIQSWSDLAGQTQSSLTDILAKYGARYQIIDPATWPQQAKLANAGSWSELVSFQKSLDAGRESSSGYVSDAKVEKVLIRKGLLKRYKQDDMKVVEGIGPKIESLLMDAGISSWAELGNTSAEHIQRILDAAGDRYNLADPSTWPKQARLAAEGRWSDLEEYQEELRGGRE